MSDSAMLINLTRALLDSITDGNWEVYEELCDPSLTCFEPEAQGQLVEGMGFHRFYFDLQRSSSQHGQCTPKNTTLASPHVRIMGDTAVVSYVRLVQFLDADGLPRTNSFEETRIWRQLDNSWKHVHFHRSQSVS